MLSDHGPKSIAGNVNPVLDFILFIEMENQEMSRGKCNATKPQSERRAVTFFERCTSGYGIGSGVVSVSSRTYVHTHGIYLTQKHELACGQQ